MNFGLVPIVADVSTTVLIVGLEGSLLILHIRCSLEAGTSNWNRGNEASADDWIEGGPCLW